MEVNSMPVPENFPISPFEELNPDDRWLPDERGYIPNDSQNSQFAGIRMI